MEAWLHSININTLLELAPWGLFIGCGGTSEYLSYVFQTKPQDEQELFQINRLGTWFNHLIDKQEYSALHLDKALMEINKRLHEHGYVRVSFYDVDYEEETDEEPAGTIDIAGSIFSLIRKPLPPTLFDHSFVLVKVKEVLRFESYLSEYQPRCVPWNTYEEDLKKLLDNPLEQWECLFNIKCDPNYQTDYSKIMIVVNN